MQTPASPHVSADVPTTDTPDAPLAGVAATADDTIRRSVRALIAARGQESEDVARAVGMTRATFYRRLSGRGAPFTAGEVQAIADWFDVPVADLFSGLGGVVVPLRQRRSGIPAGAMTGSSGRYIDTAQSWVPLSLVV